MITVWPRQTMERFSLRKLPLIKGGGFTGAPNAVRKAGKED
ncbi:MAG: hypothetical protein QXU32_07015 [Nitrososphaerales archaeon]